MLTHFDLTRIVETQHKTSWAVFILLLDTWVFYQHSLPSAYCWGKEDREEKELWLALFLLFLPYHNFSCKRLANTGKSERHHRVPWWFIFLKWHCLLSEFKASLGSKEIMASWSCQCNHLLVSDVTCLLCSCFEFCPMPTQCNRNSVLMSHHTHTMRTRQQGAEDTHIPHISFAYALARLFHQCLFTVHEFKIKLFQKFFKMAATEH